VQLAQQELQVQQERLGQLAQRALQVQQERLVQLAQQELQELADPLEQPARLGQLGQLARPGLLDRQEPDEDLAILVELAETIW
jgi:hypothetical protein